MEKQKLNVSEALRYLKTGYPLFILSEGKKERFLYKENHVLLLGENKSIKMNEYDFLALYEGQFFFEEEENMEEAVDPKKDEEYYSWRQ